VDDRLQRWEDAGGTWRVVSRAEGEATIALLTCDGGTEMDRIVSRDPAVLDLIERGPA
jgi:hypothetical protein